MPKKAPKLLELARKQFATRQLSRAEENLFLQETAGFSEGKHHWREPSRDPVNTDDENLIHGDCIAWLCADAQASAFVTRDGLCLVNVRIEGDVDLSFAIVKFALRIENCDFAGNIRLADAHVRGLFLDGCRIKNLFAWRVKVDGSIGLRCPRTASGRPDLNQRFRAEGTINLAGATIGGDLDCSGADIINPGDIALTVAGAKIGGTVYLRFGFRARGETNLVSTAIGGNLECQGAKFLNSNGTALTPNSAKIGGNAYLCDDFKAEGVVDLAGAHIGGLLQITDVVEPAKAEFLLAWVEVDTFLDHRASWPQQGHLWLEGFRYKTFHHLSQLNAESRIEWLTRQPRDTFFPQPYEQLASVLRNLGHDRDARKVMIAKNRDRARSARFLRPKWWWYKLFDWLLAYGYEPWRAFGASIMVIILGTCLFSWGYSQDVMRPTKETAYERDGTGKVIVVNGRRRVDPDYPGFTPFVYSLECFTPFLKLDQSINWAPSANRGDVIRVYHWTLTTGTFLQRYLWVHIVLGWVLTSLWVGAVTGLLKT